jgi:hypothetical protein
LALTGYGIIATFQPEANFGRISAAYGGVFIGGSLCGAPCPRASGTEGSAQVEPVA